MNRFLPHGTAARVRILLALTLLLTFAAYWPGMGGGFIFDDYPNIVDNPALAVNSLDFAAWKAAAFSSNAGDQRPLSMLSFAANEYFTGLAPGPMKLTNLLLHLVDGLLLFCMLRQLFRTWRTAQALPDEARWTAWIPLAVSAAWLLLPINLTCVLYIVQRMEILAQAFVLLGLWLYFLGRERQLAGKPGLWLIVVALGCCVGAGVAAKESAALTAVYAFAAEVLLLRFRSREQTIDRKLIGVYVLLLLLPTILGLLWLAPSFTAASYAAHRDFTPGERLLTEPRALVLYVWWSLLPNLDQLSFYHDDFPVSHGLLDPPSTLAAIAIVAAALLAAFLLRRRAPMAALGIAWFFAAHLLTATLVPLELMFEHRNYFASIGLLLGVLAPLFAWHPRNRPLLAPAIGMLLIVLYAGTTALRAKEWGEPFRLAFVEAKKHPESPRAGYELGRAYLNYYETTHDPKLLETGLQQMLAASHIPGARMQPFHALLVINGRLGRPLDPAWWTGMRQSLRKHAVGGEEASGLYSLVDCQVNQGCKFPQEEMTATFEAALSHPSTRGIVATIEANYLLNAVHDVDAATHILERIVADEPGNPQYRTNLVMALLAKGDRAAATAQIDELQRRNRIADDDAQIRQLRAAVQAAKPPSAAEAN